MRFLLCTLLILSACAKTSGAPSQNETPENSCQAISNWNGKTEMQITALVTQQCAGFLGTIQNQNVQLVFNESGVFTLAQGWNGQELTAVSDSLLQFDTCDVTISNGGIVSLTQASAPNTTPNSTYCGTP